MKRKRIIFHAGLHKTGSTYLQTIFSYLAAELRLLNIDYPSAELLPTLQTGSAVGNVVNALFSNRIWSLNQEDKSLPHPRGGQLNSIRFRHLWDTRTADFVVELAKRSPLHTVLLSAEGLSTLSHDELKYFHTKISLFGDIEYVVFVRDPFDWIYSGWKQNLKLFNSGEFCNYVHSKIENEAEINGPMVFDFIQILLRLDAKFYLINFDTYRHNLTDKFSEVTGIPLRKLSNNQKPVVGVVNRSFTHSEALVQLSINQKYQGTFFPAFIRSELLKRDKKENQIFYDKNLDVYIVKKLGNSIKLINSYLLGEPLRTEAKDVSVDKNYIDLEDFSVVMDAAKFLLDQKSSKRTIRNWITHHFKILSNELPRDFDPVAYEHLNADVALAGVDPYEHFIDHGKHEGRPYRFY